MTRTEPDFTADFRNCLSRHQGLTRTAVTPEVFLRALGDRVRQNLAAPWRETEEEYRREGCRRVYYFSAEFLTGRSLLMNLTNTGLLEEARRLAAEYSLNLDEILDAEPDPGLGNGGLGRLASCFLDSLAALKMPAMGYGIRYRFGLFKQSIRAFRQEEAPDNWQSRGDIWGVERPGDYRKIYIGGHVHMSQDEKGHLNFRLDPAEIIHAVPVDYPVAGTDGRTIQTLRLWEARSPEGFSLDLFNREQHVEAWRQDDAAGSLSAVLYPNDQGTAGKHLRLKQQYFFVSASLQDMLERFRSDCGTGHWDLFPQRHVIQLNDTHPVLAIPELMRLLMDREGLSWDKAWEITTATFAYTNHTVLSEALEKWPVSYIQDLFPRLYMIIEEINRRFLESAPGKEHPPIISKGLVHMAGLAVHSCFSVNGVAALHTEILKETVLREWHALYPEKFNNKTNGITHRRWLIQSNPALSGLIDEGIGRGWRENPEELEQLKALDGDRAFLERLEEVKRRNKEQFAAYLKRETGLTADRDSLFDFQVKRFHEYKRQLLNIFSIMDRYLRIREGEILPPRTFFFGGKAAPGYRTAKEIIHLACRVGDTIRKDPAAASSLGLVFLPDYRVSMAEVIFPAAEVSQQISTAGKEASGTGNMKFMMNGALTLGTMDGANIEIFERAGMENGFVFGMNAQEISSLRDEKSYCPADFIRTDQTVSRLFDALESGLFGPAAEFRDLTENLAARDDYFVLPELKSHSEALDRSDRAYGDSRSWNAMSLRNIAASGYFSSDRTIRQYAGEVWKLSPRNNG